jgi:predicted nucleotidyltransferase
MQLSNCDISHQLSNDLRLSIDMLQREGFPRTAELCAAVAKENERLQALVRDAAPVMQTHAARHARKAQKAKTEPMTELHKAKANASSQWIELAGYHTAVELPSLSKEELSDLFGWLIDLANESSPHHSQMLMKAADVVGQKLTYLSQSPK